jgi:nucleotide-binding universal stress UspA family protein
MHKVVVAANADAEQPWVAEAACQIAQETGARVAVVTVDEVEAELSSLPRDERQARAGRAARTAAARCEAAGCEVTTAIRQGRALDEILRFYEEEEADLIIVGASTRSRLAARLLGSVPLALVQNSPRPVLVITGPEGRRG